MSIDASRFARLGLKHELLGAIADTGYTAPSPIQSKAIPIILSGKDLLAEAQTGTGKTAAYTLPLLHRLSKPGRGRTKPGQPRCLILVPTRELAAQVAESVKQYSKNLPLKSLAVFGGVNINPQRMAMRKPVDILIATPGRLLDLIEKKIVRVVDVNILVLDEADRMLDMGFIKELKAILKLLTGKRQSLLFSATFSVDIRKLAHSLLNRPAEVSVTPSNTTTALVEHVAHLVDKSRKTALLVRLIKGQEGSQVLVFMNTRRGADRMVYKLRKDNIEALALHGDKSQGARTTALNKFKDGSLQILIATDLVARGIDVEHLSTVINYELPKVSKDYVHRIGRTGRAGRQGQAISLINIDEVKQLGEIETFIGKAIARVDIEGYTGHTEKLGSTIDTSQTSSR